MINSQPNFTSNGNYTLLNIVSEVAENILNNEFRIYLDTDENIRFTRKSIKQAYEYAYEALKSLGKPSKVNEITRKVEGLYPDYETNDKKVRDSMKRQYGFVPIGRSSIFGLKEWEDELENFKGGTIRQIVTQYLDNNSLPKHYSEITSYVLQFRPKTNEYSIIQNIKLDESKIFVFFKNSFVGLSNKIYDDTYILMANSDTIENKSWEERYIDLTEFLVLNNRLPFSSSCPIEEIRLYRWYKIQVKKTINGKMENERRHLINEVINKFEKGGHSSNTGLNDTERSRKSRDNSKYTIEDLFEFISNKKRIPDSRDPNEAKLYQFYYRFRKNIGKNDTQSSQESELIDLIDKHSSSKHIKYTIDDLMGFIKVNKRLPDSRKPDERGLYHFFYRQRKLFKQGDLDQFEKNKFIEIAKVIQNHKYENKGN